MRWYEAPLRAGQFPLDGASKGPAGSRSPRRRSEVLIAQKYLRDRPVAERKRWVTELSALAATEIEPELRAEGAELPHSVFWQERSFGDYRRSRVNEYRMHRIADAKERWGKPPARTTMHQEIVCLRQILKTALRHQWLHAPFLIFQSLTGSRAWFSREEYRQLYKATGQRARKPKNNKYKWWGEQLHDFVLFMSNTGLRLDEAMRLEYRDVTGRLR